MEFKIREYFKRWPKLYNFIVYLFGPILFTGLSPRGFVGEYYKGGTVLNIGSGNKKIGNFVVNVDIHNYKGVDIVASVEKLPVDTESISAVILDNVLEHVAETSTAVAEVRRVLVNKGYVYICTPFLYPFHSAPSDYYRFTIPGYEKILKGFRIVKSGVRCGPFSVLNVYLCYTLALIMSFGNPVLYPLFVDIFLILFFPIKFLDFIFSKWPSAETLSASLYVVAQKEKNDE